MGAGKSKICRTGRLATKTKVDAIVLKNLLFWETSVFALKDISWLHEAPLHDQGQSLLQRQLIVDANHIYNLPSHQSAFHWAIGYSSLAKRTHTINLHSNPDCGSGWEQKRLDRFERCLDGNLLRFGDCLEMGTEGEGVKCNNTQVSDVGPCALTQGGKWPFHNEMVTCYCFNSY